MKKEYKKPELFFDSFELSESIAAVCEFKTGHAQNVCAYYAGGRAIFVDGVIACETITQDGYSGLCYHVPNETSNIFTS